MTIEDLQALILVGGKGTRLRSVIRDRPKPLASVLGRPFLIWLLLFLKKKGIRRIVLCTGYMHDLIKQTIGSGEYWGLEITYSLEKQPLGTGGAIKNALSFLENDHFVVINGDSICIPDIELMYSKINEYDANGILYLLKVSDTARYGTVEVDDLGEISAFHEKEGKTRPGIINAGVYLLNRKILELVPQGQSVSIEKDIFPFLVGKKLFGIVAEGPFIDIGTPESYREASDFIARHFASELET